MIVRPLLLAALGLALGACSVKPFPDYLAHAGRSERPVPALAYQSVTAGSDRRCARPTQGLA